MAITEQDKQRAESDANAIAWALGLGERINGSPEIDKLVQPTALAQWWRLLQREDRERRRCPTKEEAIALLDQEAKELTIFNESDARATFERAMPLGERGERVRSDRKARETDKIKRGLEEIVSTFAKEAPQDLRRALQGVQRDIQRLGDRRADGGPRKLADALPAALKRAADLKDTDFLLWPEEWRKGAKALSNELGGSPGLGRGLHVVIGSTGSGKSALALQLALSHARCGGHVLYVSTELDEELLALRIAALDAAIGTKAGTKADPVPSWSRANEGSEVDFQALKARSDALRSAGILDRLTLWNPPQARATVVDIRSELRALMPRSETGPAPLVIVDYLQQLRTGEDDDGDLRQRISGVATALHNSLAKPSDHNGWPGAIVLALSSTARGGYGVLSSSGTGPVPIDEEQNTHGPDLVGKIIGAAKESGEIEYCADSVWGLISGGAFDADESKRRAWLVIAKRRGQGTGACVALDWCGKSGLFKATGACRLERSPKQSAGGSIVAKAASSASNADGDPFKDLRKKATEG